MEGFKEQSGKPNWGTRWEGIGKLFCLTGQGIKALLENVAGFGYYCIAVHTPDQ